MNGLNPYPSGRTYLSGPRRKWGNWTFSHADLTLIYDGSYVFSVDLAKINSSAQLLNVIYRVFEKFSDYGGTVQEKHYSKTIYNLIEALESIFLFARTDNSWPDDFNGSEQAQIYADDVRHRFKFK